MRRSHRSTLIAWRVPARPRLAARRFKNTFAPRVGGETIGVDEIIAGLRFGAIGEASLPRDVHEAVSEELARIRRETISPARALVLLLGAVGEVRGAARLQMYAFLVDMAIYSKRTRDLFTMYGWEPGRPGPRSKSLERHVRKAVREGLVEEFPARARGGEPAGYRLTDGGKERFLELQGAFGGDTALIRGLLAEFKGDPLMDPLVAHVNRAYPEYTQDKVRERLEIRHA